MESGGTFCQYGGIVSYCGLDGGESDERGGGAIFNAGTVKIYGGQYIGKTVDGWGGFCYGAVGCKTYIYGGYFAGNSASHINLYHGASWQTNGELYGGVFLNADPIADSSGYTSEGVRYGLALKGGATSKQVGSYYVVGKDADARGNNLSGGVFTFNPTGWEYPNLLESCAFIETLGTTWGDFNYKVCSVGSVMVNGVSISTGSGTGWSCKNCILTISGRGNYKITGNTAPSHALQTMVSANANITLDNVTLLQSKEYAVLTFSSGAQDVKLNLSGQNTVYGHSNAIMIEAGAKVTVRDASSNGSLVGSGSSSTGRRCVHNDGALVLESGTIQNYVAALGWNGGCIHNAGSFTMSGGKITGCSTTSGEGGAVHSTGALTITGGEISGNHANGSAGGTGNGGGLEIRGGYASLAGATIESNTASRYGGGISVTAGTVILENNLKISGNSAGIAGGGLEMDAGSVTMNSGEISRNTVTGSQDSWTRAGGGVYLHNSADTSFTLNGGTISQNQAPVGGGVGVRNLATFTMNGGVIAGNGNSATAWGGGLGIEGGGKARIYDGEIKNNTASTYGGGICASGTLTIKDVVMSGNTVPSSGEGDNIYMNCVTDHRITGGLFLGSCKGVGTMIPFVGGVYSTAVDNQHVENGWAQHKVKDMYVIARDTTVEGEQFSLKDDAILTGVFAFDVSRQKYMDVGVRLERTRSIRQGTDTYWYVTAPPEIYVNDELIAQGSGLGWSMDNGVISITQARPYRLRGKDMGGNLGFVVSANAAVTLQGLTLARGAASRPPIKFTSGASKATLLLLGDNTLYALSQQPAIAIDSGADVTLGGTGKLLGAGDDITGKRCISVSGKLTVSGGTIANYMTDDDGAAICVNTGGELTMTSGTISGCTGGNGGAVYNAGTATLRRLVFQGLKAAKNGGALASVGPMTVGWCRFENNKTAGNGGAIYVLANKTCIEASSFKGNYAANGGALAGSGDIFMLNSTVINNQAKADGGGYHLSAGAGSLGANQFVNCTFRLNQARRGGGICAAESGKLELVNVLIAQSGGASSDYTSSVDLHVDSAAVRAAGVLAPYANLTSGTECQIGSDISWRTIFADTSIGLRTVNVGDTKQYVERLKPRTDNKAVKGYNGSAYKTDITGRVFGSCQIGSYWALVEKPTLMVGGLEDVEDKDDGIVTLREILKGISEGDSSYAALIENGVYKITFSPALSGTVLDLKLPQFDIVRKSGDRILTKGVCVEIDGSLANGKRLTVNGTTVETDADGENEKKYAYRAFSVYPGNELRLKNIDFKYTVGTTASQTAAETCNGGAIANRGKLSVSDCSFQSCATGASYENPTGYGGAIANGQPNVAGATAALTNCLFRDCRAMHGGALYNFSGCTVDVTRCRFLSNRAGENGSALMVAAGGAVYNAPAATLSLAGTEFSDNTVKIDGLKKASDVFKHLQTHLSVVVKNGEVSVALNSQAEPDLSSEDAEIDMTSSGDSVSIRPGNVKPLLWYGLGRSDTPDGEYVVETWVQADVNGNLPEALTASKTGASGYYRVMVKAE